LLPVLPPPFVCFPPGFAPAPPAACAPPRAPILCVGSRQAPHAAAAAGFADLYKSTGLKRCRPISQPRALMQQLQHSACDPPPPGVMLATSSQSPYRKLPPPPRPPAHTQEDAPCVSCRAAPAAPPRAAPPVDPPGVRALPLGALRCALLSEQRRQNAGHVTAAAAAVTLHSAGQPVAFK
jgi:hypothetical protein